ncbi:hypothetical protein [Sanguibacteroides justesenii]|uniref:DUF3244 domain-containing protein n=1 Tax=Sanguibacteroides justesenii TaxID=1547597 RepID=A0A0C3RAT3_9PORP|nr:hypothetical protein [Sanguibacteroides justesenii]KIO42686.1 hypothetical protein BA92_14100 [Sanguibacteroides justesenii]KIO46490.1 hypothetical protein IE90_03810 [Sanguibacteroides justesenii]PXZ42737.1 hypothetical protein DMB45_13715 [Sanguibacteroides justesenii]
MKNKITLIAITMLMLCFSTKAGIPVPPDITAHPTTFTVFEGSTKEVLILMTPNEGFTFANLKFKTSGDTAKVEIKEGNLDNNNNVKHFFVKGLERGTYKITITVEGDQRENSTGWLTSFESDVVLTITVI